MANEEHLKILKQGVEVWNRWREKTSEIWAELDRVGLTNTEALNVDPTLTKLGGTNLIVADLTHRNLSQPDLSGENLNGINLRDANLNGVNLKGVNLSGANLNGAKLNWAELNEANLKNANLSGADLTKANLQHVNLSNANLSRANLSETRLTWAELDETKCSQTNFSRATLFKAHFHWADLTEADFNRVETLWTMFGNVDLSMVKGLDTVAHWGPSTIGIDTIHRSKGNIPESFLRGCGFSDWEIESVKLYHPSLTSVEFTDITYKIHVLRLNAIQYYSCFISYSHKDEDFAQQLHADLQQKGVRCWFAPEDMKIGDKIRPRIDESIRIHDKLLLILSEHSINSDWVEKEVETAFEEERKRNQIVLFPVRLDQAVMETDQAWAADIRRTRHIGDFSRWKDHDAYQQAFERLLRDLQAEG